MGQMQEMLADHCYMAIRQNTAVTVLPIHTKSECVLFKLLLAKTQGLFSGWKVVMDRFGSVWFRPKKSEP
jgi:hypothetical protein